jgi:lysophospholipase L1-like esterase
VILASSLVLGIALAECAARTFAPRRAPAGLSTGNILRETDDARGYALIPGAVQELKYWRGYGAEECVSMSIDADGWRVMPPADAPSSGARVACLGDSQVFGWGVADFDALPARLAQDLAPSGAVVLNRAVPSLDAEEKAGWVEFLLARERIDVLVLELYFDDVQLSDVRLGGQRRDAPERQRVGPSLLDRVRRISRTVELVLEHLEQRERVERFVQNFRNGLRADHPAHERVRAALARIRDACARSQTRLLAVVFPLCIRAGGDWASADLDAALEQLARELELDVISIGPALAAASDGDLSVHARDQHLGALGHELAAREIARALRARGWLER